jgi:hypothetical protein
MPLFASLNYFLKWVFLQCSLKKKAQPEAGQNLKFTKFKIVYVFEQLRKLCPFQFTQSYNF